VEVQSVRAKVEIGDVVLKTPYVKSISVTRQRGVLWASASITVELPRGSSNITSGNNIKIYVSVDGNSKLLFTGYVESLDITPSMSKYGGLILNITAYDKMYKLRLLKVNRRVQTSPGDVWCAITGVTRKVGESTSSRFEPIKWGIKTVVSSKTTGDPNYDPLDKEAKNELSTSKKGEVNVPTGEPGDSSPRGVGPDGGILVHSHSDWAEGGPAVGVFGDYTLYEEETEGE